MVFVFWLLSLSYSVLRNIVLADATGEVADRDRFARRSQRRAGSFEFGQHKFNVTNIRRTNLIHGNFMKVIIIEAILPLLIS